MPAPPDPANPTGPVRRPAPRALPPKRDFAAEEEAARRLTNAHIQLRRGLTAEADAAVSEILAARPDDAGAWELRGDIQAARGDWEAAGASYGTAVSKEPGRATAETKLGRLTLKQAEKQRMEKLGVAYAASDTALLRGGGDGRRGVWPAVLGSALCPGLGQIVSGQVLKGGILAGVFVLGLGLLALLPRGTGGHGASFFGPGFWLVSLLLFADWVYAVADAALAARRTEAPPPEKDGWAV